MNYPFKAQIQKHQVLKDEVKILIRDKGVILKNSMSLIQSMKGSDLPLQPIHKYKYFNTSVSPNPIRHFNLL